MLLWQGYHGDTSRTYACGNVDEEGLHLMAATEACLRAGIAVCAPGVPFKQIGEACGKSAKQSKYDTNSLSLKFASELPFDGR